jgi:hypothetical protein
MDESEAEGTARLILLVMANRAGGDEDVCFASVERIAKDARVHVRTVQRWIRQLVALGELTPLGSHPRFATNMYCVMPVEGGDNLPVPQTGDDSAGPQLPPELKELGSTVSTYNSSSVQLESCAPSSRDELFEWLYLAQVGIPYQPGAVVYDSTRAKINKAAKQLRKAGSTVDDVKLAIRGWSDAFPDLNITALALAGNIDRCIAAAQGASYRQERTKPNILDRAYEELAKFQAEERQREMRLEGMQQ